MMGQNSGNQNRLFYSFNLEDHVPAGHLLRGINQFFDLTDLRVYVAPFYSHTGRPSIDPELMIRMLIVGYCFGIRYLFGIRNIERGDSLRGVRSSDDGMRVQDLAGSAGHVV